MKNIISKYGKYGLILALPMMMSACADDNNFWDYFVDRPGGDAEYDYLKDYDALKTYVDRSKHPDFKVSCALGAADYTNGAQTYAVAKTNFDEVVAGNAMKMASCVSDDGTMDFSTVTDFVDKAEDAGQSVYGHVLAWHSQQPVKWLGSLIADKELDTQGTVTKTDAEIDLGSLTSLDGWGSSDALSRLLFQQDGAMVYHSEAATANFWDAQYMLKQGMSLTVGGEYKCIFTVKAAGGGDATIHTKLGDWSSGDTKNFTVPADGEYHEITLAYSPTTASNFMLVQTGEYVGDIYWKSFKVTHEEAASVEIYTNVLTNSDLDPDKDMNCFIAREGSGSSDSPATVLVGQGPDGKNCLKVHSPADSGNSWNSQFFITSNKVWATGEKCRVSFWYKATAAANSETQCHATPGSYLYWQFLSPTPSFTTEWKYYEKTLTIPSDASGKMQTIAFNLNVNQNEVTYYFAEPKWETITTGNTRPLSDEEKKDTLTYAMNLWCQNMMSATSGKVKAWDMINEAVGGNSKYLTHGYYSLQGAKNGNTDSWDVGGASFYWQDYLGSEDYGPIVEKAARDAYKSVTGGDGSDLKLFVNDYNLESDWDNNAKLKSLLYWISVWEERGKELGYNTKIDGIGTQMHISYYENSTTQESKKAAIKTMFELMAASGRLVRISEMDMGYIDKDGNSLTTAQIEALSDDECLAKKKAMADFYQWIIEQYFEIVPAAQQYGICQWCITDSPAGSSWRAGQPVGIWDENYLRKPAYGGWAEGLKK